MRILFIGNTRIGDFILSSGLIAHLLEAYPNARLTIACGYTCEPLTRHIPRVERVPQNFQDQWWDTAYLTCEFNEFVTQTLTTPAGASVELIVSDPSGVLVDKTFNLGA